MSETLGSVSIPTADSDLVFPLQLEYPLSIAQNAQVQTHVFQTGDRKIAQRFLIGENTRRFVVSFSDMPAARYQALVEFFEDLQGPYQSFLFDEPLPTGGVTRIRVRLAEENLSLQMVQSCLAAGTSITLAEVPATTPSYAVTTTATRFPGASLNTALLAQHQEVFPLVKIVANGCPAIYLSDRRVTVGGTLYQPRILDWSGIGQSIDGASDQASFTLGNADRVFTQLCNSVYLVKARLEFSLFHVGTGSKLDLWAGDITDLPSLAADTFQVQASDGLWEIKQSYPARKISRTCWKSPNTSNCPFAGTCDRTWDTCGAKPSFGGIIAQPETVYAGGYAKAIMNGDNSFTSRSIVDDNLFGKCLPQVFMDFQYGRRLVNGVETWSGAEMEVDALVGMIRDENEYLVGLGFFNDGEIAEFGIGHTFNGSTHHRSPQNPNYGLRLGYGLDPVPDTSSDGFGQFTNLSETGTTYPKDKRAAGTAFVEIRTTDEEGKQIQKVAEAAMKVYIAKGTKGYMWNAPGDRYYGCLSNPIWIAVNMILRSKGLHNAPAAQQEALFDMEQICLDAAFCDGQIAKIIKADGDPAPNRKRYTFRGVVKDQKPLKDWIREVLNTALGGYTFSFGKFRTFLRSNSASRSAFTIGNIIADSLDLAPTNPEFNDLQVSFGNGELDFINDAVKITAHEHAVMIGSSAAPRYTPAEINVPGLASRDEAAVWAATRIKEELGGATQAQWIAARRIAFKTTILGLETEAGMVCSLQHPDLPYNDLVNNTHEFRILRWKLNRDFSIDIEGKSTTDSIYDMLQGPSVADIAPSALPEESGNSRIPEIVTDAAIVTDDITEDATTVKVPIQFKPPVPRGSFQAVETYLRMPANAEKAVRTGRWDMDWSQVDANGFYAIAVDCPKTDLDTDAMIYLVSASQSYVRKLDLTNTPHVGPVTVPSLSLDGSTPVPPPPELETYSLSISQYSHGEDGDSHAEIVGSFIMPVGADRVGIYTCESATLPNPSAYITNHAVVTGSFKFWYRRPKLGCKLWVMLCPADGVNGAWGLPAPTMPTKSVDIAAWEPPAGISGKSASIKTRTNNGVKQFQYEFAFTSPQQSDVAYAGTDIYSAWVNTDGTWANGSTPETTSKWEKVYGNRVYGPQVVHLGNNDWWDACPTTQTAGRRAWRIEPVDWHGRPNASTLPAAITADVIVTPQEPYSDGLDASAIRPSSLGKGIIIGPDGKPTTGTPDLVNGDFEHCDVATNSYPGWEFVNTVAFRVGTSGAYSGSKYTYCTTAAGGPRLYQLRNVVPGEMYRLSCYAKGPVGSGCVGIAFWLDAAHGGGFDTEPRTDFNDGINWKLYTVTGTVPANCNSAWFGALIFDLAPATQQVVYLDKFTLELIEPMTGGVTRTTDGTVLSVPGDSVGYNQDFTNGLAGWTPWNPIQFQWSATGGGPTGAATDGPYVYTSPSGTQMGNQYWFPIVPGDKYSVGAWTNATGADGMTGVRVYCFRGDKATFIAPMDAWDYRTGTTAWQYTQAVCTVPDGAAWGCLVIATDWQTTGTRRISGIKVTRLEPLGTELQRNPNTGEISIKDVDFSKAKPGTYSSEFTLTGNQLTLNSISADKIKTGLLEVGGTGMISRFKVFDNTGALLGWIGSDDASNYRGAWFKRCLIGGASPADAKIIAASDGTVSINGSVIIGTVPKNAVPNAVNADTATLYAGRIQCSQLDGGIINASISMTAPNLTVTGSGFTIKLNSTDGFSLTDTSGGGMSIKSRRIEFADYGGYGQTAAVQATGFWGTSSLYGDSVANIGALAGHAGGQVMLKSHLVADLTMIADTSSNRIVTTRANSYVDFSGAGSYIKSAHFRFPNLVYGTKTQYGGGASITGYWFELCDPNGTVYYCLAYA